MALVRAKWQRPGRRGKTPRLIVIHCTVSKETSDGAEAVARYFATATRPGSSHSVHDQNSTVRCVADEDTAYGAAGANDDGLHAELVGMPDQTAAQWLDQASIATITEAGSTIRGWSTKYGIPLRWLSIAQVADGRTKGLCTHADVSKAFPEVSTGHWDPGPNFPKQEALRLWTLAAPPPEEDIVKATFIRTKNHGEVYLAGLGVAPRHVINFKDARYHADREGIVILAPPADASETIPDAAGNTEKVMVVTDGTLFGIT